ncbi:MAG: M20/M25/M40 family metallo-hydrolase [Clostridia bacterium]|nr:M20/M25/M40 family metallo-hydrolase [Clostridia bacterium]
MNYLEILTSLVSAMTVSGFEKVSSESLCRLLCRFDFDSVSCDRLGNIIIRKSPELQKSAIVLDAHLDEIGFRVREICGSLLRLSPVGGIDTVILPASEVTVHGKRDLLGVFSLPDGEGEVKLDSLFVDPGLSEDELKKVVSIGDGVSFRAPITQMINSRLVGRAFDDKALAAALICAVAEVPRSELAFDVHLIISTREEIGGAGAAYAALCADPVGAVICDVNFAASPGISEDESGKLGGGPMVSLSAVTDREMTDAILAIADKNSISVSPVVESTSTGTNASHVYVAGHGIPCAVVSMPEAGMHTASECISTRDAESLIRLIKLTVCDVPLAESLTKREVAFNV